MIKMPVINIERCNGCGLCIGVCQFGAVVLINNTITFTETEDCDWCTQCEAVCPTGAIGCPFEIIIRDS